MKHHLKRVFWIMLILVLSSQACSSATSEPTATPTQDPGPELTASAKAEEEAALQASQTAEALATVDAQASLTAVALATQDAQATADAQVSATAAQKKLNSEATRTQRANDMLTATAESILAGTAQAQPMYDIAQTLYQNGILTTAEGEYIPAADWEQEWAQINYYQYWPMMESFTIDTSNFIVRANFAWSSASDNANWNTATCGFVILDVDSGKNHLINLGMDGYANLYYNDGGGTAYLKAKRITNAKGIPEGQAEFVLAVQGQTITVYVNGVEAYSFTDTKYIPGLLAYTLGSGTNKGYGTRCEMTDVGLWRVAD
jgi:hypothetical protein